MNVKRFIGRNSREAMQKVRLAFGDNAVVLSTKPCTEGIEILAMPPESVEQIERFGATLPEATPAPSAARASSLRERASQQAPRQPAPEAMDAAVQDDVGTLAMSTLSFQDYVRERMLKKRQAELRAQAERPVPVSPEAIEHRLAQREYAQSHRGFEAEDLNSFDELLNNTHSSHARAHTHAPAPAAAPRRDTPMHEGLLRSRSAAAPTEPARREPRQEVRQETRQESRQEMRQEPRTEARQSARAPAPRLAAQEEDALSAPMPLDPPSRSSSKSSSRSGTPESSTAMMKEIRAMKGLIEERFGALAFMERLQKSPKQAALTTKLIDCGFSPALIRKLVDSLGDEVGDEVAWATSVLQRNLLTAETEASLEDQGGVYALIGSTGVGKTTSAAKLAAAFASRHGAANLGLITLDAYRLGAHEQLRAYGRILGVPVHVAHDRVALEDLLDLLSAKKMIIIDTAGLAQRDSRTREALEMLSHPSIQRLLVVNAAAQGETIEDVLIGYKATQAKGVVLSKLDEAVKLGPALDAVIRHRIKVLAIANGQRVPEDWHRLTAQALMHRALKGGGAQAWRMDAADINLMFSTPPAPVVAQRSSRPSSRDAV